MDDASKGLSQAQKNYMRLAEQQNAERAAKMMKMRRNNMRIGSFLGLSVMAVYAYTIFSVKQEKFLDELE